MASRNKRKPKAKPSPERQTPILVDTAFEVGFTTAGDEAFGAMDKGQQRKVLRWMKDIAPLHPMNGKPLRGLQPSGVRAKKLGDIRILYLINEKQKQVRIFGIDWRKDVYDNVQQLLNRGDHLQ